MKEISAIAISPFATIWETTVVRNVVMMKYLYFLVKVPGYNNTGSCTFKREKTET